VRGGHKLAEAAAGERGDFGKRLVLDQARHEFASNRDGDFDRFAFEPRLDRRQSAGGVVDTRGDALEGRGDAPADFGLRVALPLGEAAPVRGCVRLGELGAMFGNRDGRLARGAGGEIGVEEEFCRRSHQ
jgi:hypothetical protein